MENFHIFLGFVYPFLAHWMWGANGWLGDIVGARVRIIQNV
jgi:ammonia channel protein AmtB